MIRKVYSDWDDNRIVATTVREVDSRILYRSGEQKRTVVYEYCNWGEWSDWGFDTVSGSQSRKIETRIIYRYADKEQGDECNERY